MNIEEVHEYCISLKGVTESFPFDEETLVFKVMGKMFAYLALESHSMNLKCDPDRAIQLRESYTAITAGYHMSKVHWNSLNLDSNLPEILIKELINHSYHLVVAGLTRKLKEELHNL